MKKSKTRASSAPYRNGALAATSHHKQHILSKVQGIHLSPTSLFHVSSSSYDGTCKSWDIRSLIHLPTIKLYSPANKEDHKALSFIHGNFGMICMGGTDYYYERRWHNKKLVDSSD